MEFTVQTWQDVYKDCFDLFKKIKVTNFQPDIVIGIARGGWVPARLFADFFHLKDTANIKVEAYQMVGQEDTDPVITQKIQANLKDKHVLLIDDVVDTGGTIETVLKEIKKQNRKSITNGVLYYKPHATYKPDFYVEETSDWVIFSWSFFETIDDLYTKWEQQGMKRDQILKKCKEIGIPENIIDNYSKFH